MSFVIEVLSPRAGRGLGEGRRGVGRLHRSFRRNPRIDIGETAPPSRPSPNPLPTLWGEGLEARP